MVGIRSFVSLLGRGWPIFRHENVSFSKGIFREISFLKGAQPHPSHLLWRLQPKASKPLPTTGTTIFGTGTWQSFSKTSYQKAWNLGFVKDENGCIHKSLSRKRKDENPYKLWLTRKPENKYEKKKRWNSRNLFGRWICCFFCKVYLQKFTYRPEMEVLWGFPVFKRLRLEKPRSSLNSSSACLACLGFLPCVHQTTKGVAPEQNPRSNICYELTWYISYPWKVESEWVKIGRWS